MYQPMLFLHWKQIKVALIPFMVIAFGLPLMLIQGLGTPPGMESASLEAYRMLKGGDLWITIFPTLAAAIGLTLALSSWNWDHQLKHVYALSLPLPRWKYAMLKMGAGAVLAALPAGALWVGAQIAAHSVTLPVGLNAYPSQLALRFFAATLVSYAALFAMAAGTVRTTLWIVCGAIGFLFFGNLLNGVLAGYDPYFLHVNVVDVVLQALVRLPGPLHVFTGNWMLIDV